MKYFEEIKKALKQKGAKGDITKDTLFKSLGLDSLDLMDLVVELEEKLGFTIPDDELPGIQTIGQLEKIIENLKK
ncbi:putative acyl carrier protein [Spiroplasma sabaudiense Ar-1343]|uniref:Putative acyl carrier protein n=1 Tax=Spiroplasma sabaudiense Ar-1343 TaxID=1276257 RepID=W6AK51_9MOLU|nr:acyl carrier protein [Spiroplasma sabaudiense]AHI54104.1 putative acyl carrier protein [Spiroplasma sabaudiense Ar-1343]